MNYKLIRFIAGYTSDEAALHGNHCNTYICKETGRLIREHEYIGLVEQIWKLWGGGVDSEGLKYCMNPIPLIKLCTYSEEFEEISKRLKDKGFSNRNIIL